MQGNTTTDFTLADKLAGFSSTNPRPNGYTWHHHQDGQTMMLVPSNIIPQIFQQLQQVELITQVVLQL